MRSALLAKLAGRIRALTQARRRLCLLAALLAATLFYGLHMGKGRVDAADSAEYLAAAYHLHSQGVLSQALVAGPVAPENGREPGYPLLLSVMMAVDPTLHDISPECLASAEGCGKSHYRYVVLLNGLFIGVTGLLVYATVSVLGGGILARWLAGTAIWLNVQGAGEAGYVMSDYLALFLVALLSFLLAQAVQRDKAWRWALAGFALAALCLVKAIFLYLGYGLLAAMIGIAFASPPPRKPRIAGVLALALAFSAPVGSWMVRNAAIDKTWTISAGRMASALGGREAFDHMTPAQYAAGLLYWTRGSGDGWAKALFPERVWGAFELYRPNGFYLSGTMPPTARMNTLMRSQDLTVGQADQRVVAEIMRKILDRPVSYLLSFGPVFWRGIWMDEFILVSLPALVWLAWRAVGRRQLMMLACLAPGLFSLVFYPLVSFNIPRFQVTALPSLAMALGLVLPGLGARYAPKTRRALRGAA
jgi:hypothetical protein